MMHHKDPQLIAKSLAGNKAASKQLYERYEQYWFRLCLRYGHNRSEAQDIFQEGVVKVFQGLDKFDVERGIFKNWSSKIMVNEALKYLKKHEWQHSFKDIELAENEADVSINILEEITVKELIKVVQQLPAGYRIVFNMYEIEGYTHREIAEVLRISVGTSKSQLFKAKKTLQQKLKIMF